MAIRITRGGVGLGIGITILALVVLGGLYVVAQRGEQARREDAVEIAEQNLESESNGNGALNPSEGNSEGSSNGTSSDENTSTDTSGGSGTSSDTSGSTDTTTTIPAGGTDVPATNELPQTGPGDLAAVLAIGLLTFAGVSYFNSRRVLARIR